MKSHIRYVLVGLAVAVLAGCGSYGGDDEKAEAASFAAAVEGSDAFVGAVVGESDRRVLAYVCDGKSIASWFTGEAGDDGNVELTSADGARLTGRVEGDLLSGSVVLPGGASHRFSASAVSTPAGLYRAKGQVRGAPAVGGWVVLEDGSQRGGIRTSTGFTSSDTDLARPPKPVTSFTSTDVDF
jgi:hypothetical protein